MTDFLSRVAARAVGVGAAARPRLAGLFEPAGTAGDPTLELVEEEVAAPAPPREDAPVASEHGRAPAPVAGAPSSRVVPRADPPEVPSPPRPTPLPDVVAQSSYVPAPPSAIGPRAPRPEPVTADRAEQSEPARLVAAAPLAQARPAAVTRDAAPPPAPAATRVDEAPVRVHIGRLEVRANIQSPQPERPRREPPRPEGLSLADYLRGKREARS